MCMYFFLTEDYKKRARTHKIHLRKMKLFSSWTSLERLDRAGPLGTDRILIGRVEQFEQRF